VDAYFYNRCVEDMLKLAGETHRKVGDDEPITGRSTGRDEDSDL